MSAMSRILTAFNAVVVALISGLGLAQAQPHPAGEEPGKSYNDPDSGREIAEPVARMLPGPESGDLAEAFETLVQYEVLIAQTDLSDPDPADLSGFGGELDESEPAPQAAESGGGPY